jgi:hypothetical protein
MQRNTESPSELIQRLRCEHHKIWTLEDQESILSLATQASRIPALEAEVAELRGKAAELGREYECSTESALRWRSAWNSLRSDLARAHEALRCFEAAEVEGYFDDGATPEHRADVFTRRVGIGLDKLHAALQPAQSADFTESQISGYFEKAKELHPEIDEILKHVPETMEQLLASQSSAPEQEERSEPCLICQRPVYGYEPQMCCSGHECGCMGQPMNPCVCSKECSDALFGNIGMPMEERRKAACIPLWTLPPTPLQEQKPAAATQTQPEEKP